MLARSTYLLTLKYTIDNYMLFCLNLISVLCVLNQQRSWSAPESATIQYSLPGPHLIIACPRKIIAEEESCLLPSTRKNCLLPSTTQEILPQQDILPAPQIVLWREEDSTPLITGEVLQVDKPADVFLWEFSTTLYCRTKSHFCGRIHHISVEESLPRRKNSIKREVYN